MVANQGVTVSQITIISGFPEPLNPLVFSQLKAGLEFEIQNELVSRQLQ